MSFLSEFKTFALKGNVIDLAIGVIIGAAFGKIVDSIVTDLIMPVISSVLGGLDFSNYYLALAGQAPWGETIGPICQIPFPNCNCTPICPALWPKWATSR